MSLIKNKVVIIMGASSGIGEATANLLAKNGAKLIIAARRVERLEKIVENNPDSEIYYQPADVTSYEEVQREIDLALEKFGRIDVLYNNAGIMPLAPLSECRRDEWQKMLDVNIMGVLNGISAVLPTMINQKGGHIIATDSVAGQVVYPDSVVYCGTKYAVRAIMEGLRQEHREDLIKSTIISPGAVATELYTTISDKKAGEALYKSQLETGLRSEDIAEAVLFAINTPERMSVNNMLIRPTTQSV